MIGNQSLSGQRPLVTCHHRSWLPYHHRYHTVGHGHLSSSVPCRIALHFIFVLNSVVPPLRRSPADNGKGQCVCGCVRAVTTWTVSGGDHCLRWFSDSSVTTSHTFIGQLPYCFHNVCVCAIEIGNLTTHVPLYICNKTFMRKKFCIDLIVKYKSFIAKYQ